ncbi:Cadherin-related tumor suppressor [Halotydeus destructor]|nr:Cadherin-related tumor suppressor [Halotydeus destructor]
MAASGPRTCRARGHLCTVECRHNQQQQDANTCCRVSGHAGPPSWTVIHFVYSVAIMTNLLAFASSDLSASGNDVYFVPKTLLKQPSGPLHVSELIKLGQVIYEFEPLASDRADSAELKVAIVDGDPGDQFLVDRNQLRVKQHLDYEKVKGHQLSLEATRAAHDNASGDNLIVEFEIIKLDIVVTNENDNYPQFSSDFYNATILEEEDEPILVIQLHATDSDLEVAEGHLRYAIVQPPDGPFKIDHLHGSIWTTGRIDRELNASFDLIVSVEDEGSLSTTCHVHVAVEDKNDNPPRFTRLFSANISENAARGDFVIQVTSSDKDLDTFAEATYSFIGPENETTFEIEPRTGNVYLVNRLDREVKEEYLLIVAVNDSSWRAQTTLTINVLDENDNAPKFEKPVYEFKRATTSQEAIVGQVKATDADKSENGTVEYSLKHSNQYFYVKPQTGEVLVKPFALSKLVYSGDETYLNQHVLTVVATDQGQVPLSGETTVVITVLPDDDLATYLMKEVRVPVPTDMRNGTIIYNLRSPEMALLLEDSDGQSLVRSSGGKVVFQGEGRVTKGQTYNYKFISTKDEFDISLAIVSPNAFSPKFSQPDPSQVMVVENRQTTEPLGHFIATDDDMDIFNKDITYSYNIIEWKLNDRAVDYYRETNSAAEDDWKPMVAINFQASPNASSAAHKEFIAYLNKTQDRKLVDPFRIDKERGKLYLASPLDYELIVMYRLEVTARDNAWFGFKNSSVVFTVYVSDANDNVPVFTNLQELTKGLEVFENNLVGHIVGEVAAVDFDSPPNSQIAYELEPVLDYQNFSISVNTGQIQALVSFDYERQSEYQLKVSAKNNNEMKQSTLVRVRVKDINEFEGKFAADPMSVGVMVVILFFIVLLLVLVSSFVLFRSQKKKDLRSGHPIGNGHQRKIGTLPLTIPVKHYHPPMPTGPSPASTLMHMHQATSRDHRDQGQLGHNQILSHQVQASAPTMSHHGSLHPGAKMQVNAVQGPPGLVRPPDLVDPSPAGPLPPPAAVRAPPAPPSSFHSMMSPSDNYSEILVAAEHYDLENASSIAPSDIDLVYHYKGYRHDSSSGPQLHRHVPLARLSPSVSEMTAPRILTLHDLSPQSLPPCPPNMALPPPPPPLKNGKKQPPRSQAMMHQPDSSDDDGADTVDSFTSSEFDAS